jgi:hypothetical protein
MLKGSATNVRSAQNKKETPKSVAAQHLSGFIFCGGLSRFPASSFAQIKHCKAKSFPTCQCCL